MRVTSWIWVLELLRGASALTPEHLQTILDSMTQQVTHIYRYPSFYISPNTHLIGEAFGLFLFGCLYPEYALAGEWQSFGRLILEQELDNQFEDNGVHSELSTYYHCYCIEYYVQFALLAAKNDIVCSVDIHSRLGRMYEFLKHLSRPDGTLPMIGDGDGGRALPLVEECYGHVRSLLGIGAIFLCRKDLQAHASGEFAESIWLLGADFQKKYKELHGAESVVEDTIFSGSNFIAHRFGDVDQAHHLVLNGGEMGFLSAGHSHADYLHIELSLFGAAFLTDPGTYSYKDESWRNYARSTAAHNTVTVDGLEQATVLGMFGWQELPPPAKTGYSLMGNCCLMAGSHGCYPKVTHTRSLLVVSEGCILITDHFLAEGQHHYCYHYHLDPDITPTRASESIVNMEHESGVSALFDFGHLGSARLEIVQGDGETLKGWNFPRYGNRGRTCTIELTEAISGDFSRTAVIVPQCISFENEQPKISRSTGSGYEQVELTFLGKKMIYQYFSTVHSTFSTACYVVCCSHAISFWNDGNSLEKLILFNVTLFEYEGQKILQSTVPAEAIMMCRVDERWVVETLNCASELQCTSLGGIPFEHIRRDK